MKYVVLSLVLAAALLPATCRKRGVTGSYAFPEERQARPPAATARDWNERMDASGDSWQPYFGQLYAELPPLGEWPAVIDHLHQATGRHELKYHVFGDLLAGDDAAVEKSLRALILKEGSEISDYDHEEAVKYLHTFSKDPAEARRWIEKNAPKLLEEKAAYSHGEGEKGIPSDKIDEAIAGFWKEASAGTDPEKKLAALVKLATLGRLLERPELADKAIAGIRETALRIDRDKVSSYQLTGAFNELSLRGDWKTIREISNRYRGGKRSFNHDFHATSLIATHHLDGSAALLEELAKSGDSGLRNFEDYASILNHHLGGDLLGNLVVRAYHETGDDATARTTLAYVLAMNSGTDSLYRLALELYPDSAADLFRSLLAYNPYEERPLIWLADLALSKGDPDGARTLVDQAIALDPSDGEQGKDTRMQAYDVLSRILRAKGDNAKADFFAKVTSSIRQGEIADDFISVGLFEEAIRRYKAALGEFGDAYCLQSRLAKTLLKQGKFEEAKVHFEKAFELMPVSFGPVESHCFGCERIFEDDRVREMALVVFRRLIAENPQNPRTHYLLGLVLQEMKLRPEAIASFQKALELDPKYYNCAIRLHEILGEDPATLKDANALLLKIVGISPYPYLADHFKKRTDIRQLWLDAQTPPASPLKLEPLPLPFKSNPAAPRERFHFVSDQVEAIDGWSTSELLRDNALVDWVGDL